jgi:GT2 family glycosyltransferase
MQSDWVLIEAQLDARHGGMPCSATMQSDADQVIELRLSVLANGQVHELIRIPGGDGRIEWRHSDGTVVPENNLLCRRVGWFERIWRMSYRVFRNWLQCSADERRKTGLTFVNAVVNLPMTYCVATEFRFPFPYADWVARLDTLSTTDISRINSQIASWTSRPQFRIVLDVRETGVAVASVTLESLRNQLYRDFECTVVGGVDNGASDMRVVPAVELSTWLETFNTPLASAPAAWVLHLRAGDVLPVHALYQWGSAISNQPDAVVIYSDDDEINVAGERVAPRFKPDWSLAHLRATNYLGNAVAVRADALASVGGLDEATCRHGLFDKILQVIDLKEENVIHLPAVLLHNGDDDHADAAASEMHAVQRHLVRRGIAAAVSPTLTGCRRIRYQLPTSPPLVSIIIPTRDGLEILRRCVDSVLAKTTYARYEILIIDNQSRDPAALTYLHEIAAHPAVRVILFDRPFNFSAINNFAAAEARGELLCLLNNDTEVITPDWLEEMVGNLLQDQVGVVGAKLFYPDGRVQHAGDTVGPGGCANHLHNGIARDDPGYCNRAVVAQDLAAVTAACLLTRRDLYLELGGLDARWLRVAFNDVDYCLRVRSAGWRVVWTPHAELYHHESVSRGKNDNWRKILRSEFEVAVMRRRWRHVMRNDPFYNPNLNYRQPDFTPGRTLRIRKPWL